MVAQDWVAVPMSGGGVGLWLEWSANFSPSPPSPGASFSIVPGDLALPAHPVQLPLREPTWGLRV